MSGAGRKLLNAHAIRCEPYNDGHWCFAYDPAHADQLRELGAHDALLGFASGVDADERVERIAKGGLAVAWELTGDGGVVVDVLVGKKLTSGQRAKAQWLETQTAYLDVPSGRLRIETLNTLAIGPDEMDEPGCEVEIPVGAYDVALHRVAWELMDDDPDERPEIPTEVLALSPVKRDKPKRKAACLSLAEALGQDGAWLTGGGVDGGVFHGVTRAHDYDASILHVNLRGAHAERMGLRFGRTLELVAGDASVALPCTGYLTERGMKAYFGTAWFESHFGASPRNCSFSPFHGSTPWLLDAVGTDLPAGVPVTATVGSPWCEAPLADLEAVDVGEGRVVGRILWTSESSVILNCGWAQLRAAKVGHDDVLELACGDRRRRVYLGASARDFLEQEREAFLSALIPGRMALGEALADAWRRVNEALQAEIEAKHEGHDAKKWTEALERAEDDVARLKRELDAAMPTPDALATVPLLAESMTFWDNPEVQLLWLAPFVGEGVFFDVAPGTEIRLRVLEKAG